ncbi:MAG: efflux RND transporter periplasmic adaptor subunit [bacterium]|nr:efflux RND transporter periplasmic adaptor subunit [bacterium]
MKKWIVSGLILIVLIGISYLVFVKVKEKDSVEVVKGEVNRGELVLKVTARGRIEARERYEIYAKISSGVITSILEEGAKVRKGEVLAGFDSKELLAGKKQEESNLVTYRNRLLFLKRGFGIKEQEKRAEEAGIVFEETERNLLSRKGLLEREALSEDEFRKIEVNYKRAKLAQELALTQLEEHRQQQKEEMETISAQIESAGAALSAINRQLEWTKVISPISGIITQKTVKEGAWVPAGRLLCIVVSSSSFVVKTNLDEVDISKISPGMEAVIVLDAFPGQPVSGRITKIAPSPVLKEKLNVFEVTIFLEPANIDIRSEMLADVNIISSQKTDVLKVPHETIVDVDDETFLFVIKDNKAIKRKVVLGLKNPNEAEVLSGVKEGEEVVLNPPLDLKDGAVLKIKGNSGG